MNGVSNQAGNVIRPQLAHNMLPMCFHRLGTDAERQRDALGVRAVRDVNQDLSLAARQDGGWRGIGG